jgi:hypothetical protein
LSLKRTFANSEAIVTLGSKLPSGPVGRVAYWERNADIEIGRTGLIQAPKESREDEARSLRRRLTAN